jgi:hypothetical protein
MAVERLDRGIEVENPRLVEQRPYTPSLPNRMDQITVEVIGGALSSIAEQTGEPPSGRST